MVFLFAGISNSEVDDSPVGAGIIVLGGPECAVGISERQSSVEESKGIILCQHFGSVGFVAAVKVQIESILDS